MKIIKKTHLNLLIILSILSCSSGDDGNVKPETENNEISTEYYGNYEGQKDSEYGLFIFDNKVKYTFKEQLLGEGEVVFKPGPLTREGKEFNPPLPDTLVFTFNKQCVNSSDFLLDKCIQKALFNDPYIIPLQRIASQHGFVREGEK